MRCDHHGVLFIHSFIIHLIDTKSNTTRQYKKRKKFIAKILNSIIHQSSMIYDNDNDDDDEHKHCKVQIRIHAHKLKATNCGLLGSHHTFRPCAAVRVFASSFGEHDQLLGETEVIENATNPEWVKQFDAVHSFGKETKFSVTIFNKVKSSQRRKIGSATFEIGEVLSSRGCVKVKKLRAGAGSVVVRVSKAAAIDYGTLNLQLRGIKLMNVEGFLRGKSDPYFILKSQVKNSGGCVAWQAVYRSECIKNNLNPKWSECSVAMECLCGGNKDRPIQLEVWDWQKNGRDRPMGKFQTTVNGLLKLCCKSKDGSEDYGECTTLVDGFTLDHHGKSFGQIMVTSASISGGGGTKRISRCSLPVVATVRGQDDVQERFVPFLHTEGKIFRKELSSYIRRAIKGEEVVTIISGVQEGKRMVDDDSSWVVCAKAAGETYVLNDKEFHESYNVDSAKMISEDASNGQWLRQHGFLEYESKRYIWARAVDDEDMRWFRNGTNKPDFAHFIAPWGETMRVEKGDFLVMQYVPDGKGNDEVYRVEKMVFGESYDATNIDPNSNEAPIRDQSEVQKRFLPRLHGEGEIFRKKVTSYIRKATKGEIITTTIDGVVETQNTVNDDTSWVVCGKAAGEFYILTNENLHESYNVDSAKLIPKTIPNSRRLRRLGFLEYSSKRFVWGHIVDAEDMEFLGNGKYSHNIAYFVAPWGEKMRVELNDYLVTQHVPNGHGDNEVYRVERNAFEDSYINVDESTRQQKQIIHEPVHIGTPDFVDYISGGTEVNLMVAIDFSSKNGNPREPESLHHFHKQGRELNDYEKALTAVGSIVGRYDSDQLFPVLGFGAKIPPNPKINHCFQVGSEPELKGVSGMIQGYRSIFSLNLTMSGPAEISHVIRFAASQARSKQDKKHRLGKQAYSILLVLTNGAVSDFERAQKAIRQASTAPLSIVMVGIGNSDFSNLQDLDDFQSAEGGMTRDIVKFVEFSKYSEDRQALTKETLDEIPEQLVSYFYGNGILPLPPHTASVPDILEEECDEEDDRAVEIDTNGHIVLSTSRSSWSSQSYGDSSHFLRPTTAKVYGSDGQLPLGPSSYQPPGRHPTDTNWNGSPQIANNASPLQPANIITASQVIASGYSPPVSASAATDTGRCLPQNDSHATKHLNIDSFGLPAPHTPADQSLSGTQPVHLNDLERDSALCVLESRTKPKKTSVDDHTGIRHLQTHFGATTNTLEPTKKSRPAPQNLYQAISTD